MTDPAKNPLGRRDLVKESSDGGTEGTDPRSLDFRLAQAYFGSPKPLSRIIREKCLDCCCGVGSEVRKCTAVDCPLWPYRMGSNPLREKRKARGASLGRSSP